VLLQERRRAWRHDLARPVCALATAAMADERHDVLVVACYDGAVYCLDRAHNLTHYHLNAPIRAMAVGLFGRVRESHVAVAQQTESDDDDDDDVDDNDDLAANVEHVAHSSGTTRRGTESNAGSDDEDNDVDALLSDDAASTDSTTNSGLGDVLVIDDYHSNLPSSRRRRKQRSHTATNKNNIGNKTKIYVFLLLLQTCFGFVCCCRREYCYDGVCWRAQRSDVVSILDGHVASATIDVCSDRCARARHDSRRHHNLCIAQRRSASFRTTMNDIQFFYLSLRVGVTDQTLVITSLCEARFQKHH
jgi:hypothetical protein